MTHSSSLFFSSIDFVSLVGGAGLCLCCVFSTFFPSQCALSFWNNMGKRHPVGKHSVVSDTRPVLVDVRITVSFSCLRLSPEGRGARRLMAPILYSRRQVEWEPASSLIEGVCLTLQRQPIISFLPHLRSLINVCVNLVSSQVAIF